MVRRAYPSRGDKHCGSATPPDVLSSALSGVTKHAHRESRHEGLHSYPPHPKPNNSSIYSRLALKNGISCLTWDTEAKVSHNY